MQSQSAPSVVIHLKDCYEYDAVCPHDSLHFKSMEEWKDHHLEHHMDTKWECPLCGIKSSSWHNYSYHVQTSKHKSVCPSPWICKLERIPTPFDSNYRCGARFGSKYQLIRHVRATHSNYTLDEICGRNKNRKRKYEELMDDSPSSTVSSIPSDRLSLSNPGNINNINICNLSMNPWTECVIPIPPQQPLLLPHDQPIEPNQVPVIHPFPPAKRRKLSHRPIGPNVISINVPYPMSIAEGIHDLTVNGGLNLFLNALSIFRQNEERAKLKQQDVFQQKKLKNAVHVKNVKVQILVDDTQSTYRPRSGPNRD